MDIVHVDIVEIWNLNYSVSLLFFKLAAHRD